MSPLSLRQGYVQNRNRRTCGQGQRAFEYESVDLLPYDSHETLNCRLLRRFYIQFPDNYRNLIVNHFLVIGLVDSVYGKQQDASSYDETVHTKQTTRGVCN